MDLWGFKTLLAVNNFVCCIRSGWPKRVGAGEPYFASISLIRRGVKPYHLYPLFYVLDQGYYIPFDIEQHHWGSHQGISLLSDASDLKRVFGSSREGLMCMQLKIFSEQL